MRLRMGTFAIAVSLRWGGAALGVAGSAATQAGTRSSSSASTAASTGALQRRVDAVKKGSKSVIKIKPGTYHEGVILSGHKYDGLSIVGTNNNAEEDRPRRQERQVNGSGQPAQNGIDATNVDGLKIKNLWARNFQTNGFFVHSDNGTDQLQRLPDEERPGVVQPLLRPVRQALHRRPDHPVDGLGPRRLGDLHRRDAAADEPEVDRHRPRQRRTRTCSATPAPTRSTSTSTTSTFYNNGAGVVPNTLDSERFEPNATGKIRNNDDLLEQLQLLPAELAGEDRLGRPRHDRRRDDQLPDRGRRGPVRLRRLDRSRTTRSSATSSGASPRFSDPFNERGASTRTTSFVDNTDGPRTAPTRTSSTSSTTAPARATASRATRPRPSTSARPRRTPSRSCIRTVPAPNERRHRDQPG